MRDQRARLLLIRRVAQEEHHLDRAVRRDADHGLQGGAGIQARADAARQDRARGQAGRHRQGAVAADEFAPVAGPPGLAPAHVDKGGPFGEGRIPRVGGQHGAGIRIQARDDEGGVGAAIGPQHPFHIAGHGQAPGTVGGVAQGQAGDLDRVVQRHELHQLGGDAVAGMFKAAVAPSVPRQIGGGLVADRQRCGAPQVAGILVANIEGLARPVGDRVVGPGRQLMFLAVGRPGVAAALSGDLEAEAGIGDDIDPGRRGRLAGAEYGDVFAAILAEAADAVEEFQPRLGPGDLQLGDRVAAPGYGAIGRLGFRRPLQLVEQAAAFPDQDDAGDGDEQGLGLGRNHIGAQHEDVAGRAFLADLRPRLAGPHQGFQGDLQVLDIGDGALVEDHQIHRQPLHAPVFHRLQRLAGQLQLADIGDAHQDDRQIPRYAQAPQVGLAAAAGGDHLRGGAQGRGGEDGVAGQALELSGRGAVDAQVMQLDLGLGPGQGRGAAEGAGVMMLVDQVEHLVAGSGGHGPEVDPRRGAGRDPDPAPQGEDGVQHGACGPGQGPAVDRRRGGVDARAAAEETRAIGLELPLAHGLAIHHGQMRGPDLRVGGRAQAAGGQDRAQALQMLGLYEHLGKGRMGDIRALGRQHQFGIGGDFDLAQLIAKIENGHAPHLGVVLGGHQHFQAGGQLPVTAGELGVVFVEDHRIAVRLGADGLIGGRPGFARGHVPQKDVGAPIVAGGVLAPAGHRQVAPIAVAGAGGGHHHRIAAVRQHLGGRCRAPRAGVTPGAGGDDVPDPGLGEVFRH